MPVCSCKKNTIIIAIKTIWSHTNSLASSLWTHFCQAISTIALCSGSYSCQNEEKDFEIRQYAGWLMKHILEQREGGKTHTKVSASVILGDGNHRHVARHFPLSWSPLFRVRQSITFHWTLLMHSGKWASQPHSYEDSNVSTDSDSHQPEMYECHGKVTPFSMCTVFIAIFKCIVCILLRLIKMLVITSIKK